MVPVPADAPYTMRGLQQMLGLSRGVITGLVAAGYVSPRRGPRNEYRFSFQDVVLLRTAYHLRSAHIPNRRLLQSLRRLRARLPAELPPSGLRLVAVGQDVVVRDAESQWDAGTGQLLMDFEPGLPGDGAAVLDLAYEIPAGEAHTADDWFVRGQALEGDDPLDAEQAYRQALALDPAHVAATINLGALLCESGRCASAVELYEQAAGRLPDSPLIHFNAAIALEDLQRDAEALARYQRCLALAPDLADAHFNAARLCERLGDAQGALRHSNAFRRLQAEG